LFGPPAKRKETEWRLRGGGGDKGLRGRGAA